MPRSVRRSLLLAGAAALVPAFAFAADTPPAAAGSGTSEVVNKVLNHDDLTMYGITFYGTVDVGVAYQSHGAALDSTSPTGLEYVISKNSNKAVTSMAPGGLSASKLGVKGTEELAEGWSGIFKLETSFLPTSGQLADGPGSLTRANGKALNTTNSYGDSSRAGQAFNSVAYGGVDSTEFGTLTLGRHNGLVTDNIGKYDPQGGSYAFSVIGYSGAMAGAGDTQDARLDSSVRYYKKIGPVHGALLYQFGDGSGADNSAYEVDLGADYAGFSFDAAYTRKKDAISAAPLTAAQALVMPANSLAATVSDNTAYNFMAMYDAKPVKVYGGYEFIRYSNPSSGINAGSYDVGNYLLSVVNNNAYSRNKVLQVFWTGAKYAVTPKLDVTGAYYGYYQPSYATRNCSDRSSAACSGMLNAVSVSLDYKLSKRFDVYGGAMYSRVSNGLASGYLHVGSIDPVVGFRYNF